MPSRIKKKTNNSHSEIARKIDMISKGKNENKEAKSPRVEDEPKIADKKSDDSQKKKFRIVKKEKKLKPSKALELQESKRFQEKLNEPKQ